MKNLFIIILFLSFTACSIFQSTEEKNDVADSEQKIEEVYVFDEVSESEDKTEDIKEIEQELNKTMQNTNKNKVEEVDVFTEEPVQTKNKIEQKIVGQSHFLQLGAFSTLQRAEQFVKEIESQVSFVLSIIYNSNTSLYTVRSSAHSTKPEVELIKQDLWNKNLFKDAFIITE